jgi:putative membrane protein
MNLERWQQKGQEPDYRFSLANERTFLAWIRTALAILASGVALDQLVLHSAGSRLLTYVALGLVGIATMLSALAYFRWRANQIAMRNMNPLPSSAPLGFLAWSMMIVCLLIGSILFSVL